MYVRASTYVYVYVYVHGHGEKIEAPFLSVIIITGTETIIDYH